MKKLAFKLFMFTLSRFTGTGWGQSPLIKLAYKHMRRILLPRDDITFDIHGFKMYQHGREDYRDSDETLFTDGYERTETKFFNEVVKEGMTVVDIGANIGYYTLLACRNVGGKGKVFAYEPEHANYKVLQRNVKENGFNNAILLQQAVGDKSGKVSLFLSPKGHGEHSIYESGHDLGNIEVDIITLDECFDGKVDVMKMDIEGGELSALVGMEKVIKQNDDVKLFVEFYPDGFNRTEHTPQKFWSKLRAYGFEFIYIINEKTQKLELGDYEDAIRYSGVSSVNLLCAKHRVMVAERKVVLLGAYPPPYGGVSVHVQRLKREFDSIGMPCIVHSYKRLLSQKNGVVYVGNRMGWFLRQLFLRNDEILHCHGYSPLALLSFSLLALLKKRVVVTTHGFLFKSNKIALWHKLAFKLASMAKIYFVVTSPQVRERILSLGIKSEYMTQDIIPAFIPPSLDGEDDISPDVDIFLNNHYPIIGANAYRIVFFKGVDLYGLDMCVELCARLKEEYPNIGLLFALPEIGDYRYFDFINNLIAIKGINDNVYFITNPCEFYSILKKCDVFVRPTCIDDYGVSVAEAIYFGVPAVASDVCPRAEGTMLFRSRDVNDFTNKVWDILHNYDYSKDRLREVKFVDTVGKLIEVYQKLW